MWMQELGGIHPGGWVLIILPRRNTTNTAGALLGGSFVCVCVCCVRTVLPCLFPELVFFSLLLLLLLRLSRVSAGTISSRRYLQRQQQQYRAGRFRQLREYFRLYWYWSCCGK
jgi:hypothetical protein